MRRYSEFGHAFAGDAFTPEVSWERRNPAGRADFARDGSCVTIWNFSVGSAGLKPEHVSGIRTFARDFFASGRLGDVTVTVEAVGHSSSSGPRTQNRDVSRARAQAAARVFADELRRRAGRRRLRFVERFLFHRFSVRGEGSAEPIRSNATAEGMARNRRVELCVLQVG